MRPLSFLLAASVWCCAEALAQDTVPPVPEGVRVGITYTPGVRPGLLVLGGPHTGLLDSVRAIIARDLDYSDRFEIITLPSDDSLVLGVHEAENGSSGGAFVNYGLYAALGADYAVHVHAPRDSLVIVSLYDVQGEGVRGEPSLAEVAVDAPSFRLAVHRVSDRLVQGATGTLGVAATRLLLLQRRRVYRVDTDGADVVAISPSDESAFSPGWGPGGKQVVYTQLTDGGGRVYLAVPDGARRLVTPTARDLNYTPVLSPDGEVLAFSRSGEDGTDIYTYNVVRDCCLQRLTIGRFSDNLSPTFSPDGRRIAFVSTRAGLPQIYAMTADGTGQELFAPFDYGVTGSSNAPEWSPDGLHLAFHRDVAGSPQVFIMDVATQTVRQLTSAGRNEDPTWAPDGRHLAFVSNRTGNRQLWIIDIETGRVRQLTRLGDARLPAWSPRID
ncbi:MAG TPA: DPP IV N-terminal domain-containing protein [Gemmatimonadales bacterium]